MPDTHNLLILNFYNKQFISMFGTYSKYNNVGNPVMLYCILTPEFSGRFTSIAAKIE